MVNAVVELVAVVAYAWSISTADICISKLLFQAVASVRDGRVVQVATDDDVGRCLLLHVGQEDIYLCGTLGCRVAQFLYQLLCALAADVFFGIGQHLFVSIFVLAIEPI